jgi:predicted metal-dependent hydrolase
MSSADARGLLKASSARTESTGSTVLR